jgi:hypothetical protein
MRKLCKQGRNGALGAVVSIFLGALLAACGGGGSGGGGGGGGSGGGDTTYTITGTVTGLPSSVTLGLLANGHQVSVTGSGPLSISLSLATGTEFSLTVPTQPSGLNCTVTPSSGPFNSSDTATVTVGCLPASQGGQYTVGGTVANLPDSGFVILQDLDTSGAFLDVNANGSFSLPGTYSNGASYNVGVVSEPSGENCTVANPSGAVAGANVGNVQVNCSAGTAATESTIYAFGASPTDGQQPIAGLTLDPTTGNLYGTTYAGGANNTGTFFVLTKNGSSYTETILYSFGAVSSSDAQGPEGVLVADSAGNLYGTSQDGGAHYNHGLGDGGTVFELVKSGASYTETVLYSFGGTGDGCAPVSGLVLDPSTGNLFGTAIDCGPNQLGVVFELVKSGSTYTEQILHSFGASAMDGGYPVGVLTVDSSGNLYGATSASNGSNQLGTVYTLTKSGSSYGYSVIYTFSAAVADGEQPESGVTWDPTTGNLYGTTLQGGSYLNGGTVYRLAKNGSTYTETVLFSFAGPQATATPSGYHPKGDLLVDSAGNIYGTAYAGANGGGTVFKLVPGAGGAYTEVVLHAFAASGSDGTNPQGLLVQDSNGNLFGTATIAGPNGGNAGTAFEITP